jgi:hypothetical protein
MLFKVTPTHMKYFFKLGTLLPTPHLKFWEAKFLKKGSFEENFDFLEKK